MGEGGEDNLVKYKIGYPINSVENSKMVTSHFSLMSGTLFLSDH